MSQSVEAAATPPVRSLMKIVSNGWKKLANADQEDAEELKAILHEILDAVESIEATVV